MLFRTSYSQETLECLKSLVHDERLLKKISGFILKDRWIYFKPEPYDKISEKKIKSIIQIRYTRVRKVKNRVESGSPFSFQ